MAQVFGEVADVYDRVRPGYPAEIATAIVAHHGRVPAQVTEIGAGTGKGTEVLALIGAPIGCIEPDARMAAVLRAKFPDVDVHVGTFEQWVPPQGGVPVLACALAWHWLDPAGRDRRAYDALEPGGTLAVFGHTYGYTDPSLARQVDAASRLVDPSTQARPEHRLRRSELVLQGGHAAHCGPGGDPGLRGGVAVEAPAQELGAGAGDGLEAVGGDHVFSVGDGQHRP